jgi:hypothetical protein
MQRSHSSTRIESARIESDGATATRVALWTWFACGFAALLLFPDLRGRSQWFGWLPFWLVVAPLIDLAVIRRDWLAATSHAFLVRARRRRRSVPQQARRPRYRRIARPAGGTDAGHASSFMPEPVLAVTQTNRPNR